MCNVQSVTEITEKHNKQTMYNNLCSYQYYVIVRNMYNKQKT